MEQYRNGVWKILCSRFFSQYIPEESAVLDLGAGWGEFINNVKANSKFAMDLNADTKEHLNEGDYVNPSGLFRTLAARLGKSGCCIHQ